MAPLEHNINPVTRIAVFASGSGTNAENLIKYFSRNPFIEVALIVTNNPGAYVLKRADDAGIPAVVMDKEFRNSQDRVMKLLEKHGIGFIVLAGYLLLIPAWLVRQFPEKIVNIHPALLPRYGGKGMYGEHVHRAVIESGDKESGITIHLVNEQYDQGDIIFQARCPVLDDDTPETLAKRIHELEYQYFPAVIEKLIVQK